jgi:putative DNA primase/helicase
MPYITPTAAEIASRLNLKGSRGNWRGTCPACDYDTAFSLRETTGRPLIYCANGCSQEILTDMVNAVMGCGWTVREDTASSRDKLASRERRIAAAIKIWDGSVVANDTPADSYLTRRGLRGLAASEALRFHRGCRHPDQSGTYPALVAIVVDVAGQPIGVHRTYLTLSGLKANLDLAKASKGLMAGGAIRLDNETPEIVVGEGIESSASAGRILGLPAWAAISAGNLGWTLALPVGIKSVVIAADADKPGEKAAQAAEARWQAEGRRVRIARPTAAGQDFNDVLLALGRLPDAE